MYSIEHARDEKIIFEELEELCQQPGYAHIIAYFCFRDNSLFAESDDITKDDILKQYNLYRLLRSEISLLIGLMTKNILNFTLPEPELFQNLIIKTEELLQELHTSMIKPFDILKDLKSIDDIQKKFQDYLKSGTFLREPMFYGGESAYHFQYREFSKLKYSKDNDWFIKNKGYSVEELYQVIKVLENIQSEKVNGVLTNFHNKDSKYCSVLDGYKFSIEDISSRVNINNSVIGKIIDSFTLSQNVQVSNFNSIGSFNPTNAYPIISLGNGSYLLFQYYSLVEALYETPFFWFNSDLNYKDIAMVNRGSFTEEFSYEKLKFVFGEDNVFKNVDIKDTNSNKLGEIDVLVIFGNRAIILQAKSKKLTIPARQGNDKALSDDFQKAIQASYDQAVECGKLLLDSKNNLILPSGKMKSMSRDFIEIYPISIVSDHYPALATQARQFLKQVKHEIIQPAFVIDIFTLDVITEMLKTPLYFLSYINRRSILTEKVMANHELTILAYHLKSNLYLLEEHTMLQLDDNLGAELDFVMLSRRTGLSEKYDIDGILTKYKGTFFERLIKSIEWNPKPQTIDLGFELLMLNEETVSMLNKSIDKIRQASLQDGKLHDLVLTFDKQDSKGVIVHCTNEPDEIAMPKLIKHCEIRKYKHRANSWYGIAIDIENAKLRFGVNKNYPWEKSDKMEQVLDVFPFSKKFIFSSPLIKKNKIGRNDPCPCGSGKKFKKCCINNC
ncbi:SEC-C metal-binding domain-containing protein [Aggregatibacter kilianii]|uniref:SEC-C metal-binding domain-containing protein n=1 Tax=Aggregatibacter kilianii TaxID=2025884 RepID=UPI000D65C7A7|nr:SEC-C metal-binding domain-containing protein [Aggregatibacter kilianii]